MPDDQCDVTGFFSLTWLHHPIVLTLCNCNQIKEPISNICVEQVTMDLFMLGLVVCLTPTSSGKVKI